MLSLATNVPEIDRVDTRSTLTFCTTPEDTTMGMLPPPCWIEESSCSIRNVTVGLHTIENYARKRGMEAIAMADWPKGAAFFLGTGLTGRKGEH